MSSLPRGWVNAALGDVTLVRNDKRDPTQVSDLRFIGLEDVEANSGRIIGTQDASSLKSAVTLFAKGDVLYGRLRLTLPPFLIQSELESGGW